jgi:hypothetical protein
MRCACTLTDIKIDFFPLKLLVHLDFELEFKTNPNITCALHVQVY